MRLFLFTVFSTILLAQQPVTRVVVVADAGANDTYTGCPTDAVSAYTTGMRIQLYPNTANTGASTFNLCSLGAKTIKKTFGAITNDTETGDILAGKYLDLIYDGTNLQIMSSIPRNVPIRWTLDGGGSVLTAATGPSRYIKAGCTINIGLLFADQSGSVSVLLESAAYTTGTPSFSTVGTYSISSATNSKNTTEYTIAPDTLLRPSITGTPSAITSASFELWCN